ncbi:SGNH/GDSL hydrolase family protein [Palleronia sp. KMU-117]|uniref:SGNH/GDSL hydrolase family protein n=1 Tax=Palleronia sp. KMU-117 TaxID=3434108 RepID=UPI003D725CAC
MTRTLLCFGDSNTHGTLPFSRMDEPRRRHGPDVRWPCVAARHLGPDWALVEEGLPGRTAQFADPLMGAHMDGRTGLRIALESHGPIDLLAVMLGTNDVKAMFGATPEMVSAGMAALLNIAVSPEMQARHGGFRVLVICPPPVEEAGCLAGMFFGGRAKALALPPLYRSLSGALGAGFLDAGEVVSVSPIDGVHYDDAAHAALGAAVARKVEALMA